MTVKIRNELGMPKMSARIPAVKDSINPSISKLLF